MTDLGLSAGKPLTTGARILFIPHRYHKTGPEWDVTNPYTPLSRLVFTATNQTPGELVQVPLLRHLGVASNCIRHPFGNPEEFFCVTRRD